MLKKVTLLLIFFLIIIIRLYTLSIVDGNSYRSILYKKTNNYVYGPSYKRGRILDVNGKVLVDNKSINTLFYKKTNKVKIQDELKIAKTLANIIDIKINNNYLKDYYLITHNNGDDLIKEEEWDKYKLRHLSSEDIKKLKYERISEEDIKKMSNLDRKSATIYGLMNKGYSYENKILLRGIKKEDIDIIKSKNLKGITIDETWDRVYNYGNTLKDIFGTIGYIPEEEKDYYLDMGYELNDIVGLSYLEKEYEDYLKGEKDLYKVNRDNSLTLIKEGKPGNDLILSIDIDTQLELEKIIEDNMKSAKKRKNTKYFSESYAILGKPKTGEIVAMVGKKLEDDGFKNNNTSLINSSFTVGSVVKMGTISAGYKYKVIDIGTKVKDGCIKLYRVPIKCSYKYLGIVNDLDAIAKSSNYYQFRIALGLTNNKYKYNMKLNTTIDDFNKLRNMYQEYGLGSITGVDLPNEKTGIVGKNTASDLLLNLSIGQYDTYTPMELFQYVNTIADTGKRRKPQLMKEIRTNTSIKNDYEVINEVSLDIKYKERLKEAMHKATVSGTARNYIKASLNPAGKTGTSETFIDTDKDGIMDTKTTSIAFLGFFPYDNPEYSLVLLEPNLYIAKDYSYKKVYITRYISQAITNFLFEK